MQAGWTEKGGHKKGGGLNGAVEAFGRGKRGGAGRNGPWGTGHGGAKAFLRLPVGEKYEQP